MSITTRTTRTFGRRSPLVVGLALASALALSACASDTPTTETDSATTAAQSIQIVDGWVKAVDEGMTAAFGVLENSSATDVTLVSASATVSPMIELHEVVMNDGAMVMRQKQGGIDVPAGASHELAPGQDHIMMMGVSEPLLPGDEVLITFSFSDGSTLDHAFAVKDFAGADEEYVGDGDLGDE